MDKPSCYAAAIRYDPALPAPFVTASGRGELAERLLVLAMQYGVPVQSAPELAQRLVHIDPHEAIPEELFVPVAQILSFILDLEDEQRRASR